MNGGQICIESPASLWQFARASKLCHTIAGPFIYRSIELSDDAKKLPLTQRMVRRLLDPNDEISWHVRDLDVADFKGDSEVFNASNLEHVIGKVSQLQSFRSVLIVS